MSEAPRTPDELRRAKVITPRSSRPPAPPAASNLPATSGGNRVVFPTHATGARSGRLWTNVSWRRRAAVMATVGVVVVGGVALTRAGEGSKSSLTVDPKAAPVTGFRAPVLASAGAPAVVAAAPAPVPPVDSVPAASEPPAAPPEPAVEPSTDEPRTIASLLAQSGEVGAVAPEAASDVRSAVQRAVTAYAVAIGDRDLDELSRLYPRMSDPERASWVRFFRDAADLEARLDVRDVRRTGDGRAEGRVVGVYTYGVGSTRRVTRQPVDFVGRFTRDAAGVWHLDDVR